MSVKSLSCILAGTALAGLATAQTVFVWSGGSNAEPYDSWETAATDLNLAVEYACSGNASVVQLTNETYTITSQLLIEAPVTVRGAGRDATTVRRDKNAARHRIFYLDNAGARVEALTASDGDLNNGDNPYGGGMRVEAGTLADCAIRDTIGQAAVGAGRGVGLYLYGPDSLATNCVVDHSDGGRAPSGGAAYIGGGATATHCSFTGTYNFNDYGATGAGVFLDNGTLTHSTVSGNLSFSSNGGSGIYMTDNDANLVDSCVVSDNVCASGFFIPGVGIFMGGRGSVRNCLVARNSNIAAGNAYSAYEWSNGGGIYVGVGSVVDNCTIIDNYSVCNGGGIYAIGGTIRNCVISGNAAALDGANVYTNGAASFSRCVVPGGVAGEGNIDGTPVFMDAANGDYRLLATSPGFNAGAVLDWMDGSAADIAGNARVSLGAPDAGAYEYAAAILCGATASPISGLAPLSVTFTATVHGDDLNGLTYSWDFDGDGTFDESGASLATVSHTYQAGTYTPVLCVSNAVGDVSEYVFASPVSASPADIFVSTTGSATPPYSSWESAARDIQTAVDQAADGVSIHVAAGTYPIDDAIVVDKAVTIEGVAGAADTIVQRNANREDGNKKFRVIKMANPGLVVRSLTLSNGYAYENEGATSNSRGGGAYIIAGTLADCVIDSCFGFAAQGVGFYLASGLVTNCVVSSSKCSNGQYGIGGYVAGGEVVDTRVTGSTIGGNVASTFRGAGLYVDGGVVRDCTIDGNNWGFGSGAGVAIFGGLVDRCLISGNYTRYGNSGGNGGGAYIEGGTLRNSVITENSANNEAGGVYLGGTGSMENCTVVGNYALNGGGGAKLNGGSMVNCIVSGNSAGSGDAELSVSSGSATYCVIPGGANGEGNIAGTPVFADAANGDYTLDISSPGFNAGDEREWMDGAKAFNGVDRIRSSGPDVGACETPVNFAANFAASHAKGLAPIEVSFTITTVGAEGACSFEWDYDGDGLFDETLAVPAASHEYPAGVFSPVLRVTCGDDVAVYTGTSAVVSSPLTLYVSPDGGDSAPYDSWEKAAKTVGDAVAVAAAGSRVVVSNGTYMLDAPIEITEGIVLESLAGADETILRRNANQMSTPYFRIIKMDDPALVVRGFTLANGYALEENGLMSNSRGGGAYILAGTLADCVIDSCFGSTAQGVGFYLASGTVTNCLVKSSLCSKGEKGIGGYVEDGLVVDTRITGSSIRANVSPTFRGSGLYLAGGTALRCTIDGNSWGFGYGAGLAMTGGLADRCAITNNVTRFNSSGGIGGGAFVEGGVLRNSLVAGNSANGAGDGVGAGICVDGGAVENCTVVGNSSTAGQVGGIYVKSGAATNCVASGNFSVDGAAAVDAGSAVPGAIAFSCAPELADDGNGNIGEDPAFADAANGDYRLSRGSPCIGAGAYADWMQGAVDLDGNPRRIGRKPDMGCYECQSIPGTILLLK